MSAKETDSNPRRLDRIRSIILNALRSKLGALRPSDSEAPSHAPFSNIEPEVANALEQRIQSVNALADFVCEIVPFPWDFTTVDPANPPRFFDEQSQERITEQLKNLEITELSSRELFDISIRLRVFFKNASVTHSINGNTSFDDENLGDTQLQKFNKLLDQYVAQCVAVLKNLVRELGWKDVGVFDESDPLIIDASTNPLCFNYPNARRVSLVGADENTGIAKYRLQEKPMTEQDKENLLDQLIISQAKSMLYYEITGELPGDNPNWQVVSKAIADGRYVDRHGNSKLLRWNDRNTRMELSVNFMRLTQQSDDSAADQA